MMIPACYKPMALPSQLHVACEWPMDCVPWAYPTAEWEICDEHGRSSYTGQSRSRNHCRHPAGYWRGSKPWPRNEFEGGRRALLAAGRAASSSSPFVASAATPPPLPQSPPCKIGHLGISQRHLEWRAGGAHGAVATRIYKFCMLSRCTCAESAVYSGSTWTGEANPIPSNSGSPSCIEGDCDKFQVVDSGSLIASLESPTEEQLDVMLLAPEE